MGCGAGVGVGVGVGRGTGLIDELAFGGLADADKDFFAEDFLGGHGLYEGHSGYPGFLVVVGLLAEELDGAGLELGFGGTIAEEGFSGSGTAVEGPFPLQEIEKVGFPNEIWSDGSAGAG